MNMKMPGTVFFFLLLLSCCSHGLNNNSFPSNFMFGAGTSAYQIEGVWNDTNKGETIWDHAIHRNPSVINDHTNADTADQSFYFNGYSGDLDALIKMNVSHYKMSIAWSRVFPKGEFVDETQVIMGLGHYQHLIDDLLENGITPIVTLYHWDLPQVIQDRGGWTNESNIDIFVQYAEKAFQYLFKVKYFITFNEPKQICKAGYGDGTLAPFISDSGISDYKCAYVLLKAHAAVYRMYQEKYANSTDQKAKISISLDMSWSEPLTPSDANKVAAERRNSFEFGLYANPIFNGDWPSVVIERVKMRSSHENLNKSRLPEFTEEEKKMIKGSADFMAVNFYDARYVSGLKEPAFDKPSYMKDLAVHVSSNRSWILDAAGNTILPWSIRSFLKYLKNTYGDIDIIITGNGMADKTGNTQDGDRVNYLSEYLSNILDAIYEDKVKVFGYIYWSLVDSFEWTKGYSAHFGLYGVNLKLTNGTRIPKRSAEYYRQIILQKKIPDPSEVTTTSMPTSQQSTEPVSPSTPKHNRANTRNLISNLLMVIVVLKTLLFC